jgi:hypothetical protein
MSLREARALFFERSQLGPEGGYNDRWVKVEAKPFPFYFPNSNGRVAAARLHDLHHIANDYATDWAGEIEIAGWEIASGCGRFSAAWVLDVGGFAVGLFLAPRRLCRAFVRGRHAPTNLYRTGFDESQLDTVTVGELRDLLGTRDPQLRITERDVASFALWGTIATATWLIPAAIGLALFSAGMSRLKRQRTTARRSNDRPFRRARTDARQSGSSVCDR